MDLQKLVADLSNAEEPSRKLDTTIALFLGYRREIWQDTSVDPPKTRASFYLLDSKESVPIPRFTYSIDAARTLADQLLPDHAAAVVWNGDYVEVIVDEGNSVRASSGGLALCAAVFQAYERRRMQVTVQIS